MVERYTQPNLPSPVVGTPGVNRAAGAAAGEAARVAEQMTNEQFQAARNIGAAGGQVDQSFLNTAHVVSQRIKQANVMKQAYQDDMHFDFMKPGLDNYLDNYVTGLKASNMGSGAPDDINTPANALKTFNDNIGDVIQERVKTLSEGKGISPGLLKRVSGYLGSQAVAHQNSLTGWQNQQSTANLQAQFSQLLPNTLKNVSQISAASNPGARLLATEKAVADSEGPLNTFIKQAAGFPAKQTEGVNERAILRQKAYYNSFDDGISVTRVAARQDPTTAMHYLDQYDTLISGNVDLTGEQKAALRGRVETMRSFAEGKMDDHIAQDTAGAQNDALLARGKIDIAAMNNDKGALANAIGDYNTHLQTLVSQRQQAENLPDSDPFKTKKLKSVNSQLESWTTNVGMAVKDAQNIDTQNRMLNLYAQGQVRFQEGQILTGAAIQKLTEAQLKNEELTGLNNNLNDFDRQWDKVQLQKFGSEEQKRGADQVFQTQSSYIDDQSKAGIINHETRDRLLKEARRQWSSVYEQQGTDWFGTKGYMTDKDDITALEQKGDLLQRTMLQQHAQDRQTKQTAQKVGGLQTMNAGEQQALDTQLHARYGAFVNDLRKKNYSEQQIKDATPLFTNNLLSEIRSNPTKYGVRVNVKAVTPKHLEIPKGNPPAPKGKNVTLAPATEQKIPGYQEIHPAPKLTAPPAPEA